MKDLFDEELMDCGHGIREELDEPMDSDHESDEDLIPPYERQSLMAQINKNWRHESTPALFDEANKEQVASKKSIAELKNELREAVETRKETAMTTLFELFATALDYEPSIEAAVPEIENYNSSFSATETAETIANSLNSEKLNKTLDHYAKKGLIGSEDAFDTLVENDDLTFERLSDTRTSLEVNLKDLETQETKLATLASNLKDKLSDLMSEKKVYENFDSTVEEKSFTDAEEEEKKMRIAYLEYQRDLLNKTDFPEKEEFELKYSRQQKTKIIRNMFAIPDMEDSPADLGVDILEFGLKTNNLRAVRMGESIAAEHNEFISDDLRWELNQFRLNNAEALHQAVT